MAPEATSAAQLTGEQRDGDPVARLFEMAGDLLATISGDGQFMLVNPAWEELLGWSREELHSRPIQDLMHPEDVERTLAVLADPQRGPGRRLETFTNRYRHRDGSWRWLLWSARSDGLRWYASAKDVSDRMWLERQALHDPLTRLPNRVLLLDRARQALARMHRTGGVTALLFIDLDRFKAVNDSLGHDAGDRLLVEVAERLAALMRDTDTVARLGGDEFVILVEEIESESEALALGERVLDALERPFALGSSEVAMLASVGVAATRHAGTDAEALLREADVAMYRAKRAGGRRLDLFDESLREELTAHVELEALLRDALPRHELALDYQPIVPLAGGQAVACEALVRWRPQGERRAAGEELLPAAFLAPAQDSELIVQIGDWVLHEACRQAEIWRRSGLPTPVSVNISARELIELDLAGRVREQLAHWRLPGRSLCLEVSEEAVLRDPERASEALRDVRKLGVLIALDNFGSAQGLGLPRDVPLDVLKLDRALLQTERDKSRRAVLAATIALAKEARLTAVAVGIETVRQLALVRELDCAIGQGFLLHHPSGADRLRLRDAAASVTSAPWRPLVRLGSSRS